MNEGVTVLETGEMAWHKSVAFSDMTKGSGSIELYTTHIPGWLSIYHSYEGHGEGYSRRRYSTKMGWRHHSWNGTLPGD